LGKTGGTLETFGYILYATATSYSGGTVTSS